MNRLALYIFFVLMPFTLSAQEVKMSIQPGEIRIGERAKIRITAKSGSDKATITWPELVDTFTTSKVELLYSTPITEPLAGEQSREYTVTSFDSGYHAIPPIRIAVNGDTIESNALLFKVNTVEVDTSKQIFDIKEIYDEPFSWKDYFLSIWYWMLEHWYVLLALIAFTVLLVYYLLKKRKKEEIPPPPPPIDPYLEAYARLRVIEKEQLWNKGLYKEFYTSISDALRHYIERRYQIAALEQTTDEVIRAIKLIDLEEEARRHLVYVLKLSDLAKFAKEQPAPYENEAALQRAFQFIEVTKPKPIENHE